LWLIGAISCRIIRRLCHKGAATASVNLAKRIGSVVCVFRSFRHAKETVPVGSYLTKTIRSAVRYDLRRCQVKGSGISWWLLEEDNIKVPDSSFYLPMQDKVIRTFYFPESI